MDEWQMVPKAPTPDMLREGDKRAWVLPSRDVWNAMLAAAPEPPHMSMTREEAQTFQSWAGMDGACAFHLIERHANGWGDVARMMDAWLVANREPPNVRAKLGPTHDKA
jgi:hypothetical protein